MKTKVLFRSLPALALAFLLTVVTAFGQATPRVYSQVDYHKLKPGHTFSEARLIEAEWKKLHQAQANDGFILGWYMLLSQMTTNPNREYDYITITNFTDPGYLDNRVPLKYLNSVMGTDYRAKMTDISKRMGEVKEVAKSEVWEQLEGAQANPVPAPYKSPIWVFTDMKVKNGQYREYTESVKKARPFYAERVVSGGAVGWTFAGLLLPWSTEKAYDFSMVNMYPSMKTFIESGFGSKAETAFKKTMPGTDFDQFSKELDKLREYGRQEVYYLMDYAVKSPFPTVNLDEKVLDRYVGVYEGTFFGTPNTTFTVTRQGNQLFEQVTGGNNLELIPLSETRFAFARMDAQVEFVRDASGKVTKRTLTYEGQTSEAKKIK